MKPIEEQGYLIPALNTASVDYVACAVRLARSIRQFHPDANISVMTLNRCSDPVFDHVIPLPHGDVATAAIINATVGRYFLLHLIVKPSSWKLTC